MVNLNARDVTQLLDLLTHYHKAGLVRCNRCEEMLRLINKH